MLFVYFCLFCSTVVNLGKSTYCYCCLSKSTKILRASLSCFYVIFLEFCLFLFVCFCFAFLSHYLKYMNREINHCFLFGLLVSLVLTTSKLILNHSRISHKPHALERMNDFMPISTNGKLSNH